jgi:hypothetical protein
MQGQPTSEDKRAEFQSKYLRTLNASLAARLVGIEERTGRRLAEELDASPEFAELVRGHRARLCEAASDAVLALIPLAVERAYEFEPTAGEHGWSDIGAGYIKAAADLGRTAKELRKLQAEMAGEIAATGDVNIIVQPTPEAYERMQDEADGPDDGD